MTGALLMFVLSSGLEWQAAMCFTGRYQKPRYYFSECTPQVVDQAGWCAPFKTRFSARIRQPTRAGCVAVARHNRHPNMWRYRKVKPFMCDFNEGLLPALCD